MAFSIVRLCHTKLLSLWPPLDLLSSVLQAMQSSLNSKPMWKARCRGLMGLCWLSCSWSPVTSTGYWLQPQTTNDQYTRALQPLQQPVQFHWSSIAFHKRLQRWSLRQLASLQCTSNFNESECHKWLASVVCYFQFSKCLMWTKSNSCTVETLSVLLWG